MQEEKMLSKLRLLYPFLLAICAAFMYYAPTVSNISFGVIGLIWLITGNYKDKFSVFLSNRVLLLLALFLALYIMGLLYSTNEAEAIKAILRRLPIFLLPLIIGTSPILLSDSDVRIIFTSFIGASILLSFYLLFVTAIHAFHDEEDILQFIIAASDSELVDLANLRVHRPYLGLMFAFAVMLLTFKDYTFFKKRLVRLLVILFLFLALLLLIKAKMSALSLIIVVLIRFFPKRQRQKIAIGLMLILVSSLLLPSVRDLMLDKVVMSDGGSRVRNWMTSLEAIMKSPLIGHGSGDELATLQALRDKGSWEFQQGYNSHNQYLSVTIQLGLVGLIAFIAVLTSLFLYSSRYFKPGLYFVILFAFACLSEVIIARNAGVLFFGLFSGIIISHSRYLSERNKIAHA